MPYADPEKRKEYYKQYSKEYYKNMGEDKKQKKREHNKKFYKEYYKKHKDEINEYSREYRRKHRDECVKRCKQYRLDHLSERRERDRQYYWEHKEERNAYSREHSKEYHETYRHTWKCWFKSRWSGINRRTVNGAYPERNKRTSCYLDSGVRLEMTKEEFKIWCFDRKDIIENMYKNNIIPSIDRIDTNGHYSIDNIQIIDQKENSKKAAIHVNKLKKERLQNVTN
jgi:hypothetical protein